MPSAELHRLLMRVALSFSHAFAWLFVFQYFYLKGNADVDQAFMSVVLTYALTQVVTILLTPWSAGRMRYGVRGSMIMATVCAALAFALLGAGLSGLLVEIGWGVLAFALFMGVYRALYWIPYELTGTTAQSYVAYIVAALPALAGILLAWKVAPEVLLYISTIAILISIIPLTSIRNTQEVFAWRYRETFHVLFDRAHRALFFRSVLEGIEGCALLLIWPIAVFVMLEWSYGLLGIVLAFTMFASITTRYLMRSFNTTEIPTSVSATLAGSAWLMRLLVATPLGVVLVDSYYHASKPTARGMDAESFEQAAENRTYVDEFTALKEMGQGLGRTFACLLAVGLVVVGSFSIAVLGVFFLAAVCAVSAVYLARVHARVLS